MLLGKKHHKSPKNLAGFVPMTCCSRGGCDSAGQSWNKKIETYMCTIFVNESCIMSGLGTLFMGDPDHGFYFFWLVGKQSKFSRASQQHCQNVPLALWAGLEPTTLRLWNATELAFCIIFLQESGRFDIFFTSSVAALQTHGQRTYTERTFSCSAAGWPDGFAKSSPQYVTNLF
jgi:hypothetical protein